MRCVVFILQSGVALVVKEDQLLCVYNLAALDVIFQRTRVLRTDRQLKDKQLTESLLVKLDTLMLLFIFRLDDL